MRSPTHPRREVEPYNFPARGIKWPPELAHVAWGTGACGYESQTTQTGDGPLNILTLHILHGHRDPREHTTRAEYVVDLGRLVGGECEVAPGRDHHLYGAGVNQV